MIFRSINHSTAPIEEVQVELGRALDAAIDKQGGKVSFARRAGLNRATLYRLLRGENVSTEVLLRTLRALGRNELISQLLAPPEPSPLELRPPLRSQPKKHQGQKDQKRRKAAKDSSPAPHLPMPEGEASTRSRTANSLVSRLALGRLPPSLEETDDG